MNERMNASQVLIALSFLYSTAGAWQ